MTRFIRRRRGLLVLLLLLALAPFTALRAQVENARVRVDGMS